MNSQEDLNNILAQIKINITELKTAQLLDIQELRYECQRLEHKIVRLREEHQTLRESLQELNNSWIAISIILPALKWVVTLTAAAIAAYIGWKSINSP